MNTTFVVLPSGRVINLDAVAMVSVQPKRTHSVSSGASAMGRTDEGRLLIDFTGATRWECDDPADAEALIEAIAKNTTMHVQALREAFAKRNDPPAPAINLELLSGPEPERV